MSFSKLKMMRKRKGVHKKNVYKVHVAQKWQMPYPFVLVVVGIKESRDLHNHTFDKRGENTIQMKKEK